MERLKYTKTFRYFGERGKWNSNFMLEVEEWQKCYVSVPANGLSRDTANQKTFFGTKISNWCIYNILVVSMGIKLKLSGNVELGVEKQLKSHHPPPLAFLVPLPSKFDQFCKLWCSYQKGKSTRHPRLTICPSRFRQTARRCRPFQLSKSGRGL